MSEHEWVSEFPGAVTVCDGLGTILEMNQSAAAGFRDSGGFGLLGANLLDCHPEPARTRLAHLLETREPNAYTIEKRGVRKLIYQTPWYKDGEYRGFVELSLEVPFQLPHFIREG